MDGAKFRLHILRMGSRGSLIIPAGLHVLWDVVWKRTQTWQCECLDPSILLFGIILLKGGVPRKHHFPGWTLRNMQNVICWFELMDVLIDQGCLPRLLTKELNRSLFKIRSFLSPFYWFIELWNCPKVTICIKKNFIITGWAHTLYREDNKLVQTHTLRTLHNFKVKLCFLENFSEDLQKLMVIWAGQHSSKTHSLLLQLASFFQ